MKAQEIQRLSATCLSVWVQAVLSHRADGVNQRYRTRRLTSGDEMSNLGPGPVSCWTGYGSVPAQWSSDTIAIGTPFCLYSMTFSIFRP